MNQGVPSQPLAHPNAGTPNETPAQYPSSGDPQSQRLIFNSPPPQIPDHALLRRIGGGSYGEVWLARNVMGTYRAVKIVRRDNFESDRPYDREFQGIQNFEPISRSHESFVDLLQVGRNEEAGYFFYVMELADDAGETEKEEGRMKNARSLPSATPVSSFCIQPSYFPHTLASDLKRRGRLPLDECVQLGLSLTSGLAYLHKQGLVHRDIKPSNIIFVGGVPKLADIGLVAEVSEARSYVGTEGFIPPEGPGSPQADLYSLGKVLYEISTGKDRHEFPALPPNLRGLPDEDALVELNEVLLTACEGDPKKRYATAEAMHADLALLERGHSIKRKRSAEHRLAVAKKVLISTAVFALLVTAGWLLSTRFNALTFQRSNESPEVNSIAVLPFVNQSKSSAHEYLSDALTDETMNALTNIARLRVAPRPAVFALKRATNNLQQIGAQLGGRMVLAGNMKKSSNQLHVAARLFNVADGSPLWSASFDREIRDIGAVQSEVVRQVARQLNLSIDDRPLRHLETNLVRKLSAYQLYSQGRSILYTTEDALNKSIELLNRAIVQDPDFGHAYAYLAHAYTETSGWMLPPKHAMTAAKQNALRALQLDDSLAGAHMALGNVLFHHELDFAKGEAELRRAIEVDPRVVGPYAHYAKVLSELGRFEEAEQVLKRGEQVDPKAQAILAVWCWRYMLGRRFDDALRAATNYLTVLPNDSGGLLHLGWAQERLGHYDEALATAQKLVQLTPDLDSIAFLGLVHARLDHRPEAQKALEELRVMSQSRGASAICSAQVFLGLGDNDQAIEQLQRAVEEYPPTVLPLKTYPFWDDLRSDRRFQELLKKMAVEK